VRNSVQISFGIPDKIRISFANRNRIKDAFSDVFKIILNTIARTCAFGSDRFLIYSVQLVMSSAALVICLQFIFLFLCFLVFRS
jgi:hypothetical protein